MKRGLKMAFLLVRNEESAGPYKLQISPCAIGWVNLYQKFEIEKYTVCGKLILPTGTTGMRICMDLRIFASFLYPTL